MSEEAKDSFAKHLQGLANTDQMMAGCGQLAAVVASYRAGLIEMGVPAKEVATLTREMQGIFLTKVLYFNAAPPPLD